MSLALALSLALAAAGGSPAAPGYTVAQRIPGPDGGWDLASVDDRGRFLFVGRGSGVMRVELATGKVTPDLVPLQRGHDAMAVPGTDRVVATSGGAGKAVLFEGSTGKVVAEIPAGKNPDAVAYDPLTKTAWVMNAGSGDATVVDPSTGKVLATVAIGGSLELGVADGQGRLYVNVENRNDFAVLDTRARKLVRRIPLPGCEGPTGIAYSAKEKLIVSACANGVAKVTGVDGRDAGSVRIGEHPDGAAFDARSGLAMVPSAGDGKLNVFRLTPRPEVVERADTQPGARTLAFDARSGAVYLPAARYAAAAAGGRPQPTPGTFNVLVVKPGRRRLAACRRMWRGPSPEARNRPDPPTPRAGAHGRPMRILLVEDHRQLGALTAGQLISRGFVVDVARSVAEARAALDVTRYGALVLDLGLPDGEGLSLISVRGRPAERSGAGPPPVLILTARDGVEDRIAGLNAGADDYLVKPFRVEELEARLRAILRRPGARAPRTLGVGDLVFDTVAREARVGLTAITLRRREGLLEILLGAHGRLVVRDLIEEQLYGADEAVTPNALEAVVSRLRRTLAEVGAACASRRTAASATVSLRRAGGERPQPPRPPGRRDLGRAAAGRRRHGGAVERSGARHGGAAGGHQPPQPGARHAAGVATGPDGAPRGLAPPRRWAEAYRLAGGAYYTLYDAEGRLLATSPNLHAPLPRAPPFAGAYGPLTLSGPDRALSQPARAPGGGQLVVARANPGTGRWRRPTRTQACCWRPSTPRRWPRRWPPSSS